LSKKIKHKIYGRKKGRKLFNKLNNVYLNKFLLKSNNNFKSKKIILDIGSGNGENTILLAKKNPNKLIIASEVYQDGNINLSKKILLNKINNIKIFNNNILFFLEQKNLQNLLSEIWILFPDPWPKKKHFKRRLINFNFVKKLAKLISNDAKIYISTDSISYLISILKVFHETRLFNWINGLPFEWHYSYNDLPKTKYYKKSLLNKKKSFFLIFKKI